MAHFTDEQKLLFTGMVCPYCGGGTDIAPLAEVSTRTDAAAANARVRLCRKCRAWVGCHRYSDEAMGMLANAELRRLRHQAHTVFDRIWKEKLKPSRYNAYSWLSLRMDMPRHLVHFGFFNEEQCRRAIALCEKFLERAVEKRLKKDVVPGKEGGEL